MTESRPDPRVEPTARVQKALDRLHRWDVAMGWGAFNAILAELDAAWAEARSTHSDVSPDLRAALGEFGKRLAAEGYGWEAIITREQSGGEETVAHLTTANPEPEWAKEYVPGTIPADAIGAIRTLPHITVDRMLGLWVSLDQVTHLLEGFVTPPALAASSAGAATPASPETPRLVERSWTAYLIERGQPEGHVPPIYAKDWKRNEAEKVEPVWTDDPWQAYQADKEEIEKVIGLWNAAPARAVEHGFSCDHAQAKCPRCYGYVRDYLAASPPDTGALDVDAMRQAVHNVVCDRPAGWAKHGPGHGTRCQLGGWAWSKAIAAEYARLAEGVKS